MSTTDLPGSSLLAGRYRLVERLGAGGMSVVWRGFDEVLGRQVAVKVLPPSTSADPSFRRRLRAEAQAAARLSHPHITNVYDYGEATTVDGEPVPYVVMELVDGESLAAVLARVRRLPWPAAVRITSEVAAALAAAHSRGIVHRDVTPANVMLTSSGAKVVDFGISALIGENDIDPDGSLLGTPAYLAPERLEGGQVSPATDVYAVGLLIYRTLIGQLPWDVGTTTALLRAHQYTEPEPLPYVDGLPREVEALVARCLEKRPADRPSSAELAQLLASIAAGNPVGAPGYKPDWADSGEDTTILPNRQAFTSDGLGRVRPGHASVADSTPVQAGRGVAAVPAAAGAVGAAAASLPPVPPAQPGPAGRVSLDAPVSPAPGHAVPVPVSDVEDAVAGRPVTDPRGAAPETPARRGPTPPTPRNSRFNGSAHAAAAGSAAFPSGPVRSAYKGPDDLTVSGDRTESNDRFSRRKPATPGARRLLVLAGTVLALALVTYSWTLMSNHNRTKDAALPSVIPASGKCVVSYTVLNQVGNTFTASLVVANRDTTPVSNWNLWWVMPGDQVLSGNGQEKLFQADRGVTVTDPGVLAPQQTKSMTVTGKFGTSNAAPMVFQLNNQSCQAYVSGKPGDPSRPVEQLSDGTTRFGPVPTTSSPANGVTVTKGVVVLTSATPTIAPTKTAEPTKVPTASPTADPVQTAIINPSPTKIFDTTEPPSPSPSPTAAPTSLLPNPTEQNTVPASTCTFDPILDPDCPTT